jgi:dimethylargininase
MLRALTHQVSPHIAECELTFAERVPINLQLARRQHGEYCATLSRLGILVTTLAENEQYPDACFVEDTAIVVDDLAIICSMGAASRRGETLLIERALTPYLEIARIKLPATLDGGDVLRVGKHVFVGLSTRTNNEAIRELRALLEPRGYNITPVHTRESLHLKTACTAIDDETLIVNRRLIDPDSLPMFRLLFTPADEAFAANVLRVRETVCVQAGAPRTVDLISRIASKLEVIDTSELRKAEAGLTCSSIIFEASS